MSFANPEYLYLLLLVVVLIVAYVVKIGRIFPTVQLSSTGAFGGRSRGFRTRLRHVPFVLRCCAIALLIVVLARPQEHAKMSESSVEGIDIVLALDLSTSMLAEDLQPNRLEAAKEVATEFISGRAQDKMGLVVFEGESFTQCPLTTDHAVLINLMRSLECGSMQEGGTAIGMGLGTALNCLRFSEAVSKVIILLTDGENNRGEITPLMASNMADSLGVRVYTIGVGTEGVARMPVQTAFGKQYVQQEVKIDEETLQAIATQTGGKYFRAQNKLALKNIYQEIDQLERTKISTMEYARVEEMYLIFAILAIVAVVLELVLRVSVLKRLP